MNLVEDALTQAFFRTFQSSESLLIILLKKALTDLIHMKLDLNLIEQVLELLKQYELQIKHYKLHYFQIEKLLFQEETINVKNQSLHYNCFDQQNVNYSIIVDPPSELPDHQNRFNCYDDREQSHLEFPLTNQRNAKSLICDIDSYSQDSSHNFFSFFDDKFFCSQYLTTSEDEKENTSRSLIIQQLKQQLQNKLKIEPHVSAFQLILEPKPILIDFDQQLLDWKRTKNSVVQEHSLQNAISPYDHEDREMIKLMKFQHYRQKVKSAIIKRRLSSRRSPL